MLKIIESLLAIKANSITEFVGDFHKEGCNKIVVQTDMVSKEEAEGYLLKLKYILNYTAMTPRGRKVIFREELFERTGLGVTIGGHGNAAHNSAAIKHFLLAEKRVKDLQATLPDVPIIFLDGTGSQMNESDLRDLHRDALRFGVAV